MMQRGYTATNHPPPESHLDGEEVTTMASNAYRVQRREQRALKDLLRQEQLLGLQELQRRLELQERVKQARILAMLRSTRH